MKYEVHGRPVHFEGECGIYKPRESRGDYTDYTPIPIQRLISVMNGLTREGALEAATDLNLLAAHQAQWQSVPHFDLRDSLLIQNPPDPITEDIRKKIVNTQQLTDEILKALQRR